MVGITLDSLIGVFSPRVQLKRIVARQSLEMAKSFKVRHYEAASFSNKTKGWYAPRTSAVTDTKLYLNTLRDRSRELVKNSPLAARAIESLVNSSVGTGIVPQFQCSNEAKKKKIEEHFRRFIDHCDFGGRLDFYGIQSLAVRSMLESGEVLLKFIRTKDEFPLKLQILEADFIDPFKEGKQENGNIAVQGVEFETEGGKPVAYWLYRDHPGGFMFTGFIGGSFRIPATDVVHCFRQLRPHQIRGVPFLTVAMNKIRDLDQYSFAQLWRMKLSACYAAFIRDVTEQLDPVAAKSDDYLEAIEPGMIEYLPPGKDVIFNSPPESPNYPDYVRACLREIAAGLGISYEALSGDYSQSNFSSSRMGWIEFHRTIQQFQWTTLIPGMIHPVMQEFLRMLEIKGIDTTDVTLAYTPPRREMIDPTSEIKSMSEGIRNGILSLSECIRELGYEPEQRLKELARDKDLVESLGLKLECFLEEEKQDDAEKATHNTAEKKAS